MGHEVLAFLDDQEASYSHVRTIDATVESLCMQLDGQVAEHDRVLFLGGDGMAALGINALRHLDESRRRSLEVGFMAYGNRCDAAQLSGKAKRSIGMMMSDEMQRQLYHPLRVRLENRDKDMIADWLAISYVTMGYLTTGGADLFNSSRTRSRLNHEPLLLFDNLLTMAHYYVANIRKLPPLDDQLLTDLGPPLPPKTTDVVMLNGRSMASIIRNTEDKCFTSTFRYGAFSMGNLPGAMSALAQMSLRGMPGADRQEISYVYRGSGPLRVQSDGEVYEVFGAARIIVDKPLEDSFWLLTHP